MDFIAGASPRQLARTFGALYLVNIVFGAFALGVVPSILVVSNMATTAHNIQAHELQCTTVSRVDTVVIAQVWAGFASEQSCLRAQQVGGRERSECA
jgi:hypothetical protein